MQQLLNLILRVLSILGEVLGIVQAVSQLVQHTAQESVPFHVQTQVDTIYGIVGVGSASNSEIHADLAAVAVDVAYIRAHLADTVNLPPVPPSGYGGDDAAAIWAYVLTNIPGTPTTADAALSNCWDLYNFWNTQGMVPCNGAPDFYVRLDYTQGYTYPTSGPIPTPDYTGILVGDTVLSWLNRTDTSGLTWTLMADGEHCEALAILSGNYSGPVVCRLTTADLQAIRAGYAAGTGALLPPVWPGLAGVTLGAPVALSSNLTVAGPMDGVIVTVTAPPVAVGQRILGGEVYYYSMGELAFADDNGELEPWVYLGFENAVYTPKSMVQADACHLRALHGVTGTVTPWLITP